MKRLLLIALTLLAFSCGGARNYDASQSIRLQQGQNPSVEGYSLTVVSVTDGKITLSIINDETKEQEEITLHKGQELTLGDSVYIIVRVDADAGVIAPKVEPEEPSNAGGDFGGGGGW